MKCKGVMAVLAILLVQATVQAQSQLDASTPVLSGSAAQEQTAAMKPMVPDDLRYNVVKVQTRAGYMVPGYYSGLVGDSILLVSRGADVTIALGDLRTFEIETQANVGPTAVFGALAGAYFGSFLIGSDGGPSGYLKESAKIFPGCLVMALPGFAVFSFFRFSGSQSFAFSEDDQRNEDERSALKSFLMGSPPRGTIHLIVQGGWVGTRNSSKPSGLFSYPSTYVYASKENKSGSRVNLLRRFQLTMNVLPWLETGLAYVTVSEPSMTGYTRSDINDSLTVFPGYTESFKGTAFLLVGVVEPLRNIVPPVCSIKAGAGVGLGNVEVSAVRSTTTLVLRKSLYSSYTYWMTQSIMSSSEGFSETRLALSVFGSAELWINRSVSVGFFADYTVLPGKGLPEIAEWNYSSRALGNTCLGFALGWHF